ncbi:MAG: mechanosensitive ion channel [Armatimonadota bacterium]
MNAQPATLQDTLQSIVANVPQMLAAIATLVIGYIVALVLGANVQRLLRRAGADTRLRGWLGDEAEGEAARFSTWAGKFVYYVVMLFVLIAFFQILGLTMLTAPLNRFLEQVFAYAPRLVGALVLLFVALLLARIARAVVQRALNAMRIDERVSAQPSEAAKPVSQSASNTVYWLVLVLFLPAILGALGLTGLMAPIQHMIDRVLEALPNVLTATLILVVGLFVARLVRRIIENLVASVGADQLSERIGLATLLGRYTLSTVIGWIAYVLVMLSVITGALQVLAFEALTTPIRNMIDRIVTALPAFFGAVLVLIAGYVIGRLVRGVVSSLLTGIRFDGFVTSVGIRLPEGAKSPSEQMGQLALIVVMYYAVMEATKILGLTLVADVLRNFLSYAGHIGAGLAIFVLGLYLAQLAASAVRASGLGQANLLAGLTRAVVLIFVGAIALRQMGIADEIVTIAFGLLMGAVAVAAALAFGLGGREVAARELENWLSRLRSSDGQGATGEPK